MSQISVLLAQSTRGSRLVFLLGFLVVVVAQGIWHYHRFHFAAALWPMVLWSLPWLEWTFPLGDLVPPYLRAAVQTILMASGFAINSTLTDILIRVVRHRLRPNNSFKPNPLRGSA